MWTDLVCTCMYLLSVGLVGTASNFSVLTDDELSSTLPFLTNSESARKFRCISKRCNQAFLRQHGDAMDSLDEFGILLRLLNASSSPNLSDTDALVSRLGALHRRLWLDEQYLVKWPALLNRCGFRHLSDNQSFTQLCLELDLLPITYDGSFERLEDVIKILIYASRIIAMDLAFQKLSEAERRCLHLSYLHFWAHLSSRPQHTFPALDSVFYLRDDSDRLAPLASLMGEFGLIVLHRRHLEDAWTDIDLAEHIDGYFN